MRNKSLKVGFSAALLAFSGLMLQSCDPSSSTEGDLIFDSSFSEFTEKAFNSDGSWKYCYDETSDKGFTSMYAHYSHNTIVTEYGGQKYYSWKGFAPSRSTDLEDWSDGNWIDHQWTAMASAESLKDRNYAIACWDVMENPDDPQACTACVITCDLEKVFRPLVITLTNTTYGYYAMKNGTAFSRPFTDSDRLTVRATGLLDGKVTGTVEMPLAKDGEIVRSFTEFNLTSLGKVDKVVFTMSSTDSGQWGMNTPAYFAIGTFVYSVYIQE